MQSCHAAKAGTHKSPRPVAVYQGESCIQFLQKFVTDKTGMPLISRIFNQAVGGLSHGNNHGWNFETMNQVIEDCFQIRVAQIICTVMHDQQWVVATASELGWQVNLDVALVFEYLAVHLKTRQSAFAGFRIVQSPGGTFIAVTLAHRIGTERVMCLDFIQ